MKSQSPIFAAAVFSLNVARVNRPSVRMLSRYELGSHAEGPESRAEGTASRAEEEFWVSSHILNALNVIVRLELATGIEIHRGEKDLG